MPGHDRDPGSSPPATPRFTARPADWARRLSPLKIAITALAGIAVTIAVVQRPLTAPLPGTIRIAEMTWVEVRSAARARGYTRVIVPSGGIEQNGPHMVLGKHDYIVGWTAGAHRRRTRPHAGHSGRVVRAGGKLRRRRRGTCAFPARSGCTEQRLRRRAGRNCAQPEGRRLQDDLLHRRSRRQHAAASRRRGPPQPRMGQPKASR